MAENLEKQFMQCAFEFNEARYLWHHYMNKYISKYGMPRLYVGCVSYNHDREYNANTVLLQLKSMSNKEREKKLNEEIDYLKKWKFPGKFSVGIFTTKGKLVILGEEFNLQNVKFYDTSEVDDEIVYAIDIKYAGFRYVAIPKDDKRSNTEMRGLLGVCQNVTYFGHSSYDNIESIYPVDDPDLDPSLLHFEGIPLGLPAKELIYAINHIDDIIPGSEIKEINANREFLKFDFPLAGCKVEWNSFLLQKQYVHDFLQGDTETITGYENIRQVYDNFVSAYKERFGEPTEVNDVPEGMRKTSILKAIRDEKITIETIFEHGDIYASVEIQAYDEENKRNGYVHLYMSDNRLKKINNTRLSSAKLSPEYKIEDAKIFKGKHKSESHPKTITEKTEPTITSSAEKEDTDGCLLAASIIVGLPLVAIPAYLFAAFSVGDTSEEFPTWFTITYIIFAVIFIPIGYFSAKYGDGETYSSGSGRRSRGSSFWSVPRGRSLTAGWKIKKYAPAGWRKKNGTNLFKQSGRGRKSWF